MHKENGVAGQTPPTHAISFPHLISSWRQSRRGCWGFNFGGGGGVGAPSNKGRGWEKSNDRDHYFHWYRTRQREQFVNGESS